MRENNDRRAGSYEAVLFIQVLEEALEEEFSDIAERCQNTLKVDQNVYVAEKLEKYAGVPA